VGIGTTSPSYKLDVAGPVNATQLCIAGVCKTDWSQVGLPAGANTQTLRHDGAAWVANNVLLSDGASATANGNFFVNNNLAVTGNVGIGTATPGYSLHLYKASSETGAELSWGSTDIYISHGGWGIGAGKFGIGNGSVPTLTVDTINNNIGIGTTNPGTKLEVAGQIKITGGTPGAGKVLTSDATGLATWTTLGGGGGLIGGSGADNYIPMFNGASALENSAIYQADTGNIGIGIINPGTKLEVAGGPIKATGGLIMETRSNGTNPTNPAVGQIWMCTDSGYDCVP
jgi:hypothetical protein